MKAIFNRIYSSFLIAFRSTLPSITGFVVSILVIRMYSKDLWGICVETLLWINIMNHVISWGGKDYLVRKISQHQTSASHLFWNVFSAKSILYIFLSLIFMGLSNYDSQVIILMLSILLLRFIQGSVEPIIIYYKAFIPALISDLSLLIVNVAGIILYKDSLSLPIILFIFFISDLVKIIMLVFFVGKYFIKGFRFQPDLKFFALAFPFFLLGLSGFMQSRADQFMVNYYLSNADKATYQIYMNMLLFVFSFPHFFITSILKNLYRSANVVFQNIAYTIMLSGLLIVPIFIMIIYFTISIGYNIDMAFIDLLLGALFVYPVFVFSIRIYHLFKKGQERVVVYVTVICTIINVVLCLILVPELKITGALLSSAISQWIMMGIYVVLEDFNSIFTAKNKLKF